MANVEEIVGLLENVPVFEALAPDDLRRVADVAVPRRFAAQQVIFREGAGARDVLVQVTQAEIAQLAGSSRESASRFLAVLERAGIITQGRGRITVHDAEALERYIF
jgi:CRP-like cAMP-binding protein